MTEKGKPAVGTAGKGSTANISYPHAYSSTGAAPCQAAAPAHGVVRGDVWRKRVQGSRHMLRVPRPAWAVDAADLDAAEHLGAVMLELTDAESGTTYRAALRTLREKGRRFERGHGEQVALALEHWRTEQPGAARQLTLLGGGL